MTTLEKIRRRERFEHALSKGELIERKLTNPNWWGDANQDPVLLDRGKSLELYDRMARDPKIAGIERLQASLVMCADWEIEGPEAEWHKAELEKMRPITFPDALRDMMRRRRYGFKVAEVVWGAADDAAWTPRQIKGKRPHEIQFKCDAFDGLEYFFVGHYDAEGRRFYPSKQPGKFIISTYPHLSDGNWYGTSAYQCIYALYRSKTLLMKMRDLYAQNCAFPYREVLFDDDMPQKLKDDLFNSLELWQENFELRIPCLRDPETRELKPYAVVNLKEVSKEGAQVFETAISNLDMMIARALVLPDDLGFSGTSTGSFARAKVEADLLLSATYEEREKLADDVNSQLLRPWYEYNYGEPTDGEYPRMVWKERKSGLDEMKARIIQILEMAGTRIKPEWTFDYLGIPVDAMAEEEEPRADITRASEEEPKTEEEEKDEEGAPPVGAPEEKPVAHARKASPDYTSRFDHKRAQKMLDDDEAKATKSVDKLVQRIADDMVEQIKARGYAEGKNLDEARQKQFFSNAHHRALAKVLLTLLGRSYFGGRVIANREIEKAGKKIQHGIGAELGYPEVDTSKYLNPQWLREWLKENGVKLAASDRKAVALWNEYAFFVTDEFDKTLLAKARDVIFGQVGRQTGATIMAQVRREVVDWGHAHTLTVVRTNSARAFNDGRNATFQEAGGSIIGYQYSPIMDDRVSPFCEAHDGQMISEANPAWGSVQPPNHYNCRSVFVPVFIGEDFEDDWNVGVAGALQKPMEGFGS